MKIRGNFANLLLHENDFNLPVEWHFHATAHRKGARDGIGRNLNSRAVRASFICFPPKITYGLTIDSLHQWVKKYCLETEVFRRKRDQAMDFKRFYSRVTNAVTILGTLKYHAVIPLKSINRIL